MYMYIYIYILFLFWVPLLTNSKSFVWGLLRGRRTCGAVRQRQEQLRLAPAAALRLPGHTSAGHRFGYCLLKKPPPPKKKKVFPRRAIKVFSCFFVCLGALQRMVVW